MNEFNAIGRKTALLRFYFKEDPDKWSDEEFARAAAQLEVALEITANERLLKAFNG